MQNHPAEDSDIDGKQDIRAGSSEDVPAPLARVGARDLSLIIRYGRASVRVQRKKFTVRLEVWSHRQDVGGKVKAVESKANPTLCSHDTASMCFCLLDPVPCLTCSLFPALCC